MTTITKIVEVEAEFDLADIDDEDLLAELRSRNLVGPAMEDYEAVSLVERAYYEVRSQPSLPQSLRDLFWGVLGRVA